MKKLILLLLISVPMLGFSQDLRPKTRNVCSILMNVNNELLVRGEPMNLEEITPYVTEFILNPQKKEYFSTHPTMAIINIHRDKQTNILAYEKLCEAIQAVYNTIWNEAALKQYGKPFSELSNGQQTIIQEKFPKLVGENIPTGFGTIELPPAPPPSPPPPPPVIKN